MKRAGRTFLVTCFFLLSIFLCWVSAVANPTYLIPGTEGVPAGGGMADGDNPGALILLGAGLLNFAVWGRNRCRRPPPGHGSRD